MEALYTEALDGQRMLELAPLVFKAAARGDGVARGLIAMLGDEVVATANAAIRRLRLTRRRFDVILGGGIFRSGDGLLMSQVSGGIKRVAPEASLTVLDVPPVLGAALLGLDAIRAGPAARARLKKELTESRLRRGDAG
jgi:N-acetylglucosamine kinase-like BadF-type ATPase